MSQPIQERLLQLLVERDYHPMVINRLSKDTWAIEFHDSHGTRHRITPKTLVSELWWLE